MDTPARILNLLNKRKEDGTYRTLKTFEEKIDFFSNDYLGFARVELDALSSNGSTGSRLISGNSERTEEIENYLADFFGSDKALLFNSGYDANLGFFSAVPQKGDTVIYDALVHASIRDGIRMSNANSFSFRHNDLENLKDKLERAVGTKYVAVEAVYSMDGDQADIAALVKICNEYEAYLVVDEAHSGGICGIEGKGLVNELGLNDHVFARLVTFGKAFGSHGAIILGHKDLREFLINFSRSLIYTTALSPHSQERIFQSVKAVKGMEEERNKLTDLIHLFHKLSDENQIPVLKNTSAIQVVMTPGNQFAKSVAESVLESGFAVKAILSPTVPQGMERIRICLHSFNTPEELAGLINTLKELL